LLGMHGQMLSNLLFISEEQQNQQPFQSVVAGAAKRPNSPSANIGSHFRSEFDCYISANCKPATYCSQMNYIFFWGVI
jgi:hypothetical protein